MIISIAHTMLLFFTLVQVLASQLTFLFFLIFSVVPSILPIDNEVVIEGGNVVVLAFVKILN